jgi:23S rRNA pseudouridine2605 synthase
MNKKKINKGFTPYKKKDSASSPKATPRVNVSKLAAAKAKPVVKENDGLVRLNKYIANSGVCSRREADVLIASGVISINGKIVSELGTKVKPGDVVLYNGEKLKAEKKVYVLLNKPKDFITTSTDPQGRKTVLDLVKNAGDQRLFPVGRLDRNTTGLLLLTNDGELTKKLTHPKHGVRKLYHVELDKPLTKADMETISAGVEIDGEKIVPDDIAYTGKEGNKSHIGIELHSGQNRVVRRIFESLDYKVEKLDRTTFAGLTKKDLPRGHWRFLTEKEVSFLKMIR